MALDKNLFTLNVEPSKIEPSALDLVDPSGTVHYRKRMVTNEAGTYFISLSEPLSESILATAAAPAVTSKEKVIELHNPSVIVPLTSKGTLTVKWTFAWEQNTFEWKREACYMVRKPDPPVLVAVTKEQANKPTAVQILDYNLNRFDIEDRKGLEIVLLISLLTFGDLEQMRAKSNEAPAPPNVPSAGAAPPPPRPPKPEGWKDQIAVLQAQEQHDVNEVVVGEQGDVDDYVEHCVSLLNDDTLLFISLRSLSSSCVAKVVQVAEATKRRRYKDSGYDDDKELHQYVDTSAGEKSKTKSKGPRVINLDDNPSSNRASYQPPNTLTIHLSKIATPELEPKTSKPKSAMNSFGRALRQTAAASHPTGPSANVSALTFGSLSSLSGSRVLSSTSAPDKSSTFPPPPITQPRPRPLSQSPNKSQPPYLTKISALTSGSSSSPSGSRVLSSTSAPDKSSTFPPPPITQSHPRPSSRPPNKSQPPYLTPSQPPPHIQHPQPRLSVPSQPPRPTQQPRPNPASNAQNRKSYPRYGPGPQFNSQSLNSRPPQQTLISLPRPGYVASYAGPVPLNAPPQPPQPARASGKGFFSWF